MSDTEEEEVSLRVMERREEGERASLVRDSVRPGAVLVEEVPLITHLSADCRDGRGRETHVPGVSGGPVVPTRPAHLPSRGVTDCCGRGHHSYRPAW